MKKILVKILKNKYLIVCLVFIFLITIIDDNSILFSFRLSSQLRQMEAQKEFYLKEIKEDSTNTAKLQTNIKEQERYGRETYYMKRADEDIFIVQKEK